MITLGKVISVHSYRGGTGKSTVAANLAVCALQMGKRVAVLDSDLQSPGIHVLFGLEKDQILLTLVDFLWDRCTIDETAYDVTNKVCPEADGKLWLVPASLTTAAITRILDEGYDVKRLNAHFDRLIQDFELDYLLIDTHPGLNRETLLSTAISDMLILLLRPDQQDYYGTAVLSEIAQKLEIAQTYIILNKIYSTANADSLRQKIEETFKYEVVGMIPLSEDLARLESKDLIVRVHPEHEVTHRFIEMAQRIFK